MKKCTFYRCIYDKAAGGAKAVKTEGFCETVKDNAGNEITLCFHKVSNFEWCVTEKTTGFRICSADKRKTALEKVMKNFINMVYAKTHDASCERYTEVIRKAYEVA